MPHIHEKIDFTSEVFIVNGDAVLLRKHDKFKIWLSVGGHIELNEDPVEAALREVKEEVGLSVELIGETRQFGDGTRNLLPPRFLHRHSASDSHEHVTFVYFARAKDRNHVEGEKEKSDEIRWFTREELDDPQYDIKENIRFYAKAALDTAGLAHTEA